VIGNDVSSMPTTMNNRQLQVLRLETLDYRDLIRTSRPLQSGKDS
jgi:hypothetical protein